MPSWCFGRITTKHIFHSFVSRHKPQMGMRVQSFFPKISFGFLGYRMDRTHSIMRIATTASPVSGADVRDRMVEIRMRAIVNKSVSLIASRWRERKRAGNKIA